MPQDRPHKVDSESGKGSVTRMFNLGYVLKFVIYGLNDGPFAEKYLVAKRHYLSLHIVPQFCNELNTIDKQL